MAFYLVSAVPVASRLTELEERLAAGAFESLRPFGRALSAGLGGARLAPDGRALWEEEDYCRPPLAEERAAVLDRYFDDLRVEPVPRDIGWTRIAALPPLFPARVAGRAPASGRERRGSTSTSEG